MIAWQAAGLRANDIALTVRAGSSLLQSRANAAWQSGASGDQETFGR